MQYAFKPAYIIYSECSHRAMREGSLLMNEFSVPIITIKTAPWMPNIYQTDRPIEIVVNMIDESLSTAHMPSQYLQRRRIWDLTQVYLK